MPVHPDVSTPVGCMDTTGVTERGKDADPNLIVKVKVMNFTQVKLPDGMKKLFLISYKL